QVGAAVEELVGAWQGRGQGGEVHLEGTVRAAFVERNVELLELRRDGGPVLEGALQGVGDAGRTDGAGQVSGNHDQGAVAAAFLEGTKLHRCLLLERVRRRGRNRVNCNECLEAGRGGWRNKKPAFRRVFREDGSPGWIRTAECLSQSQVPYRLATGLWEADCKPIRPACKRL